MEAQTSCRFLDGLLGPQTPPIPVFGCSSALTALQGALEAGFHVQRDMGRPGDPDGPDAFDVSMQALQQKGALTEDFVSLISLPDAQREALGLPQVHNLVFSPDERTQDLVQPPSQKIEFAFLLAILKAASAYHEYATSEKRTYQLGVVTMIAEGSKPNFQAQIFPAKDGVITDTVWMYRWCVQDENCGYVECCRGFRLSEPALAALQARKQQQQPIVAPTPVRPTTGKRLHSMMADTEHEETLSLLAGTVNLATAAPPPPKKRHRNARYRTTDLTHLPDAEIFAGDPALIQGDTLLRLTERYSNTEIFDHINANRPVPVIKSLNVITKRVTHAVEAYAERENMTILEVRERLKFARSANRVPNKMKVYTHNAEAAKKETELQGSFDFGGMTKAVGDEANAPSTKVEQSYGMMSA